MRIRTLNAYRLGIIDAIKDGGCLSSGLTWDDDQDKNEAYDAGANVGELVYPVLARLGGIRRNVRRFLP